MAATSSNLAVGKAIGEQSGDDSKGRYGLMAKLMAGVAIVGCAAALAFGGLQAENDAQARVQSGPVASQYESNGALSAAQQRFLEENYHLSGGTSPLATTSAEMQYFLEENLVLPSAGADLLVAPAPGGDWATILLIEQNQLPEITSVPPGMCLPGDLGGCER